MDQLFAAIREKLPHLRASEKKVADAVLNNPDLAMRSTITELAQLAGTSEPTVVRFCRQMGLKGYMELRLKLASSRPSPLPILEDVRQGDPSSKIFTSTMQSVIEAINATMAEMDPGMLEKAAALVSEARRLEFFGSGGSGVVALDAQHKFFRLGIPCSALIDPHMQVMSAAVLGPGDVVFAISHTGSTKDILESAEAAREAGASVIGLVGRRKSPLAALCDVVLSVASKESSLRLAPMTSRLMMLAVLDALFIDAAMRMPDEAQTRLDKVKRALRNKHV